MSEVRRMAQPVLTELKYAFFFWKDVKCASKTCLILMSATERYQQGKNAPTHPIMCLSFSLYCKWVMQNQRKWGYWLMKAGGEGKEEVAEKLRKN